MGDDRDAAGDPAGTGAEHVKKDRTRKNRTKDERAQVVEPRAIPVAADTADLLQARAAALGISVSELIAALASGAAPPTPAQSSSPPPEGKARFGDARWREVKDWIDSWGKPGEKPRPKLGE